MLPPQRPLAGSHWQLLAQTSSGPFVKYPPSSTAIDSASPSSVSLDPLAARVPRVRASGTRNPAPRLYVRCYWETGGGGGRPGERVGGGRGREAGESRTPRTAHVPHGTSHAPHVCNPPSCVWGWGGGSWGTALSPRNSQQTSRHKNTPAQTPPPLWGIRLLPFFHLVLLCAYLADAPPRAIRG